MTEEQLESFRKTLKRVLNSKKWKEIADAEPDCGILACSPEIYAEMQEATKQFLQGTQDKSKSLEKKDDL